MSLIEALGGRRLYLIHAWKVITEGNNGFITEEDDDEEGVTKIVIYCQNRGSWIRQAFPILNRGAVVNLVTGGRMLVEVTSEDLEAMGIEENEHPKIEFFIDEAGPTRWWLLYFTQCGMERELLGVLPTNRIPLYGATDDEVNFLRHPGG
jgi:hypothetical protein